MLISFAAPKDERASGVGVGKGGAFGVVLGVVLDGGARIDASTFGTNCDDAFFAGNGHGVTPADQASGR